MKNPIAQQTDLAFELVELATSVGWKPGEGARSIRGKLVTLRLLPVRKRSDDKEFPVEVQIDPLAPLLETSERPMQDIRLANLIMSASGRPAIASSAKESLERLDGPRLSRSDLADKRFVVYQTNSNSLRYVDVICTDARGRARTKVMVFADATLCISPQRLSQPDAAGNSAGGGSSPNTPPTSQPVSVSIKFSEHRAVVRANLRRMLLRKEGAPRASVGVRGARTPVAAKSRDNRLTVTYANLGEQRLSARLTGALDEASPSTFEISTDRKELEGARFTVSFANESQTVHISRTADGDYSGQVVFTRPLDMLLGDPPTVCPETGHNPGGAADAPVEPAERPADALACVFQKRKANADTAAVVHHAVTQSGRPFTVQPEASAWKVAVTECADDVRWDFRIKGDLAATACARFRLWAHAAENKLIVKRLVALPKSLEKNERHGSVILPKSEIGHNRLPELAISLQVLDPDDVSESEINELAALLEQFDPQTAIYKELQNVVYLMRHRKR